MITLLMMEVGHELLALIRLLSLKVILMQVMPILRDVVAGPKMMMEHELSCL